LTEKPSTLARTSEIVRRDGTVVETPLLVPSLSSKGFAPIKVGGRDRDAPDGYTEMFSPALDALLISAFDVHHNLILDRELLYADVASSVYANPEILIIDSGWYEAERWSDVGQIYEDSRVVQEPWTRELFESVVDAIDPRIQAVLVNWDLAGVGGEQPSYDEQIAGAQAFFSARPHFLSDVVLKPPKTATQHRFADLTPTLGKLRAFDIIGIAEKDLGNSLLGRLQALAGLREQLDHEGVDKPIHLFGGLDPLYTPLYFAAGAEIFDGLSWLRYAYIDGIAQHRESAILMNKEYTTRLPLATGAVQLANLRALRELREDLNVFADRDGDWSRLRHGELLCEWYETMESSMRKRGRRRGR
jgi:hypothetical protein